MQITYDPNKNEANIKNRGLSFDVVADFDWETAWVVQDKRKPYPEVRWSALGFIHERLHSLVFTETETGIRVISFRKANQREVKNMQTVKPDPELIDDENPEWTEEMLATAVRVHDLPASLRDKLLNKGGRPVSDRPKVSTTIRFDAEVIEFFKASGKGWQTRMNAVLRDYVASH